ncbi:hypothetical protein D3C75_447570 [compost metagenome]
MVYLDVSKVRIHVSCHQTCIALTKVSHGGVGIIQSQQAVDIKFKLVAKGLYLEGVPGLWLKLDGGGKGCLLDSNRTAVGYLLNSRFSAAYQPEPVRIIARCCPMAPDQQAGVEAFAHGDAV